MRRFLTLVCLLCLAIPAGISISGCTRNPDANYCNGLGYGLKVSDISAIFLQPRTAGISLAFGQTIQASSPQALTCKGTSAIAGVYTYGTTNNQLVDISPSGNICAGTWNRNTGGGIANYTVCSKPDPLPSTGGLPYLTAYVTASAQSVTSNPVEVYVHPQVTSVTLVTESASGSAQQCFSQGQLAQFDAQACFLGTNSLGQPQQQLLCAPASVSAANYACPLPAGVSAVPSCSAAIGTLSYQVGTSSIASINGVTNQITAEQPGTTVITASVAESGSSAGYFSTCPPASINVTLQNGSTKGTITQGVTQNLTTTVIDTQGNPITGLSLNYESTDPVDISVGTGSSIQASFPGVASVYAICLPPSCNSSPINEIGLYGTGLPISSNPINVTVPGTASEYVWFGAPGQSQYFVPVELLTGTVGSPVRLPYVPNSMLMDRLGQNLYFGSPHELMTYSSLSNALTKQDATVPGVVLAVSPINTQLLINDQARQIFYLYNTSGGIQSTFGGVGNAAAWTPDGRTLYITDNKSLNDPSQGITGHTDTLYVYNTNTGWTSFPNQLPPNQLSVGALPPASLPANTLQPNVFFSNTVQTPAIDVPSVGAFVRGSPTEAYTWCPAGIVGDSASILFYPQENSVAAESDVLAATTDGNHILGASTPTAGGNITLSDIGVTIPQFNCLPPEASPNFPLAPGDALSPLVLTTALNPATITANATAVNQVVVAPASNLAFITYTGSTAGATLPYYVPGAPGTVGSVTLKGSAASSITAPLAGAFSPDGTLFFVSTSGDNLVHYISVPTLTDTQQISPDLPACTPLADGGVDPGCTLAAPVTGPVPATVVTVTTRSTT